MPREGQQKRARLTATLQRTPIQSPTDFLNAEGAAKNFLLNLAVEKENPVGLKICYQTLAQWNNIYVKFHDGQCNEGISHAINIA